MCKEDGEVGNHEPNYPLEFLNGEEGENKMSVEQKDTSILKLKKRIKELEQLLATAQSELDALTVKSEPQSTPMNNQDEKIVTYKDVYNRVADYMKSKGYGPESDSGLIVLTIDGDREFWESIEEFLVGNCSIFNLVDDFWFASFDYTSSIMPKFVRRWYTDFLERCNKLGAVSVEDESPAGIMRALDNAGI